MANYSAFEQKQGAVLERVEAICRHLTTGGTFTDTSPVTLIDVEMFMDDSYIWLCGELAKNGYSTTVTNSDVKKVLCQIQALDAVAQVEFSMPVNDNGEPNDRYKSMAARRDRLVTDYIRSDALEQLGATRDRNKSTYLEGTGRSISRKDTVYDNTDLVPGRFKPGFGQRQDTSRTKRGRYGSDNLADPNL